MDTQLQHNVISAFSNKNYELISKSPFYMDCRTFGPEDGPIRYHYHDCYELCYILSGEICYFIKDQTYLVKKGSFVLINTYEIHTGFPSANVGYKRILINFKKEYLLEILKLTGGFDLLDCFKKGINIIKLNPQEQHDAESFMAAMLKEKKNEDLGAEFYTKTALSQLLLFLQRRGEKQSETDQCDRVYHKTISEISTYICNHYDEDITLATISQRFFISPSYFSRTFKKVTGLTFIEYLNSIRVKEAQKLLTKSKMGIAEIGEKVGYQSNTHFGRVFKSIVGRSPMAYRHDIESMPDSDAIEE